jgi:hypothetical protein
MHRLSSATLAGERSSATLERDARCQVQLARD